MKINSLLFLLVLGVLGSFSCRSGGVEKAGIPPIGQGLDPIDSLKALYTYLQRQTSSEAETLCYQALSKMIELLIERKRVDSAAQVADTLYGLAQKTHHPLASLMGALACGMVYTAKSHFGIADSCLYQAIRYAESLGRLDYVGKAYHLLALSALKRRDNAQALEAFQQALQAYQQLGDTAEMAYLYMRLGLLHANEGRFSRAESLYAYAQSLYQAIGDSQGLAIIYTNLTLLYGSQGCYPQALAVGDSAYRICELLKHQTGLIRVANNLGLIHYEQGNYPEALFYFQKALQLQEALQDTPGLARSYNNIGSVHFDQRNFKQARYYYEKSLAIRQALNDQMGMGLAYTNIAAIYREEGNHPLSLQYYQKAIQIFEALKELRWLAGAYNNLGITYYELNQFPQALQAYQKAYELYTQLHDPKSLTYTYANLATLYHRQKQSLLARPYAQKALQEALALNAKERVMEISLVLAQIDSTLAAAGKPQYYLSALQHYQRYAAYKDSLFNEQNIRKIERLQAEYEHQKEVALLQARQEKERALAAAQLRQKELQRNYSLVGLGITLLALAVIAYFLYLVWQKNQMLATLNAELELTNAELASTNNALEVSNQTIKAQAEALAEKNEHILASLRYAKRIQNAILPAPERWQRLLPDSFIWYLPRDIVAGDFYWLEEVEPYIFIGVADATGHGVPGAFVSLVCSMALSKAVLEEGLTAPAEILDRVKVLVTERLTHEGEKLWDGMDIALLRLHKANPYQLTFAGANRPLWIITNQQELIEVPYTRQAIGYSQSTIPFEERTLALESQAPAMIYAFTDGLTDQIGGPQGRKLGPKRLREFFLSIASMPLSEQLLALQAFLRDWQGEYPQTDDMTCLGLRLG